MFSLTEIEDGKFIYRCHKLPVSKCFLWVWPYALTAIALIGLAYLIWVGRF